MSEAELSTLDTSQSSIQEISDSDSDSDNEAYSHIFLSEIEDDNNDSEARQMLHKNVPGPQFLNSKPGAATASLFHTVAHATDVKEGNLDDDDNLIKACQEGDLHVVESLVSSMGYITEGALHHSAGNNHWRVTQFLIDQGADINFQIAPQNATPLLWAASNGHAYIVRMLLENGANINFADASGFTALHLAVHSSNILMVAYIIHLEVKIDQLDTGKRSALHWAVVQGDNLSVDALLKAGASPNLPDGEGSLPLYHAVYTSKSDAIVALLLQYGADISVLGPSGLPAVDLSAPLGVWFTGCKSAGRCPKGQAIRSPCMSPELAKVITSLAPFFIIPLVLCIPGRIGKWYFGAPTVLFVSRVFKRALERYVIVYRWPGPKAIIQSTLLAGIFTSFTTWGAIIWFSRVVPVMIYQQPLSTILLFILIAAMTVTYSASLMMDPGIIEPKSTAQRLRVMNELMDRGHFDSMHLCVHTYVAIPARARYDFYLERVICRYDHYCPWVYNAVGIRNHRPFVIFLLSLSLIFPIGGKQFYDFTQQYGSTTFEKGLAISIGLQAIWVYVLTVVQLLQISRGSTSNEVTSMDVLELYKTDPIKAYSSLPRDHPKANEILRCGDSGTSESLRKHRHNHKCHAKAPLLLRITGINQCMMAIQAFKGRNTSNKADNGVRSNCADFWCTDDNMLNPNGAEGHIGGQKVDYYTLTEIPDRITPENGRIAV